MPCHANALRHDSCCTYDLQRAPLRKSHCNARRRRRRGKSAFTHGNTLCNCWRSSHEVYHVHEPLRRAYKVVNGRSAGAIKINRAPIERLVRSFLALRVVCALQLQACYVALPAYSAHIHQTKTENAMRKADQCDPWHPVFGDLAASDECMI